jgi:hypothetical protein
MTGAKSPFLTDEPQSFGSGWISGTIGAALGIAAFAAALCFAFPGMFVTDSARELAPGWLRGVSMVAAAVAAMFGVVSSMLRRK